MPKAGCNFTLLSPSEWEGFWHNNHPAPPSPVILLTKQYKSEPNNLVTSLNCPCNLLLVTHHILYCCYLFPPLLWLKVAPNCSNKSMESSDCWCAILLSHPPLLLQTAFILSNKKEKRRGGSETDCLPPLPPTARIKPKYTGTSLSDMHWPSPLHTFNVCLQCTGINKRGEKVN